MAMAGALVHPTQPYPESEITQQGSVPEQHAVSDAATAPKLIQASSPIAANR